MACRFNPLGRYEFLIQPDGMWVIRHNSSYWYDPKTKYITILAQGNSTVIQPDHNEIAAICQNNELIFYANGEELGRVEDDLYPEGRIGIWSDSFTPGSFINFSVRRVE